VVNQPLASQLLDDGPHAIRRSVVHDDDLIHVKRLDAGAYSVGFVVAGHNRAGRKFSRRKILSFKNGNHREADHVSR
jgi:hypothetical protein